MFTLVRYTMENNKHIGSNFDDFLEEEGMLANVEARRTLWRV